jgi:hypothetical protein
MLFSSYTIRHRVNRLLRQNKRDARAFCIPRNCARNAFRSFALGTGVSNAVSAVRLRDNLDARRGSGDKCAVNTTMTERGDVQGVSIPWALQMKAVSTEQPARLVQSLTGAILACGGWVLSRGANDTGTINMLFEFERHACVDVYSILVAAGVELSQNGHTRFTELCQCTRSHHRNCGSEIASVDLEIQTFPSEMVSLGPSTVPI